MDELTYAYVAEIDLTKSAETADGDLLVYGKATGPDLDMDGHRCDPKWLQKAVPEWMTWGNIREQHSAIAAGVGVELNREGDDWLVKALIVDEGTKEKVRKRVLKGFSIGIHGARLITDGNGQQWIVDGVIPEISLVDRPNNPTTKMAICKAAGGQMRPVDSDGDALGDDPASFGAGEDVLDDGTVAPPPNKSAQPDEPAAPTGKAAGGPKVKPARDANLLSARAYKAAVATVNKALAGVLTKAAVDESGDISGAWAAIGQIADLIISEATELKGGRPEEIYDIETLCRAVCSLLCFLNREAMQQAGSYGPDDSGDDDGSYVQLMAKFVSAASRREYAKSGVAMDNGDFPIPDEAHLTAAFRLWSRYTGDKAAAKAHIIERARALGVAVPDTAFGGAGAGGKAKGKKNKGAGLDAPETSATGEVVDIPEIVKAAVAEATKSHEAELSALRDQLAKVAATPIPGGPVLITGTQAAAAANPQQTEAARLRATAMQASDPSVRRAYLERAEQVAAARN